MSAELAALVAEVFTETLQPPEVECYSDHNEDIRVKGCCDYCGGTVWQ
jgi:hypothetical protein